MDCIQKNVSFNQPAVPLIAFVSNFVMAIRKVTNTIISLLIFKSIQNCDVQVGWLGKKHFVGQAMLP